MSLNDQDGAEITRSNASQNLPWTPYGLLIVHICIGTDHLHVSYRKKEVSVLSGRKLWLLTVLRARWRHRFDAEYYSPLFFRESLKRGKVSTIFICFSSPRRASLIAVLYSVLLELALFNKVQTLAVPILRYHFSLLDLFDLHTKRCNPRVWTRLGLFRSFFLNPFTTIRGRLHCQREDFSVKNSLCYFTLKESNIRSELSLCTSANTASSNTTPASWCFALTN